MTFEEIHFFLIPSKLVSIFHVRIKFSEIAFSNMRTARNFILSGGISVLPLGANFEVSHRVGAIHIHTHDRIISLYVQWIFQSEVAYCCCFNIEQMLPRLSYVWWCTSSPQQFSPVFWVPHFYMYMHTIDIANRLWTTNGSCLDWALKIKKKIKKIE